MTRIQPHIKNNVVFTIAYIKTGLCGNGMFFAYLAMNRFFFPRHHICKRRLSIRELTMNLPKNLLFFALVTFSLASNAVLANSQRGLSVNKSGSDVPLIWGNYHALIIGINQYRHWNRLQTAVKDAEVLKEVLIEKYRFEGKDVILRTDKTATRKQIIHDLRQKAVDLGEKDNLLIYFAGHGQLDELTGDGYWIPVEGQLKDPSTWVSHSTLKNVLSSEMVRGKNIVVIADSCYSGSLLRGGPSLLAMGSDNYKQKLVQKAALRSRQVITSGGIEPVADGGKDGHSLFAYYFLTALKKNRREVIDLENLFHAQVWKPVTEIGDQRPNLGRLKTPMDEDGQFVLAAVLPPAEDPAAKLAEQQKQLEQARLAEEQARIQKQQQELESMRQLLEDQKQVFEQQQQLQMQKAELEKQKLELARMRLAQEKKQLSLKPEPAPKPNKKLLVAAVDPVVKQSKLSLRTKSAYIKENKLRDMLHQRGFYETHRNQYKSYANAFSDLGDETVADRNTGLIWQKAGSSRRISIGMARRYIRKLNKKKFGGYSDWRLPTIEELASLNTSGIEKGAHINPITCVRCAL